MMRGVRKRGGEGFRCFGVGREWARVPNCTAARCVRVVGAFRGFRCAQPPAIERHRFAMRRWALLLALARVGVVIRDAGASGNRRSPLCGEEA
jgi:hypothetical protein